MSPSRHGWPPEGTEADVLALAKAAVSCVMGWLDEGLIFTHNAAGFVASVFAIRCTRNLNATVVLCGAGYAIEAQTMLRNMVEDMVTLSYISTDPARLARQWLQFENPRLAEARDLMHALSEELERDESGGPPQGDERDRVKWARWTKLSLTQMAKRADTVVPGIQEYVDYVYPVLSDRVHGNTTSSTLYFRTHPQGGLEALYQPSIRQMSITLCNGITLAVSTIERAVALGVDVKLHELAAHERAAYDACGLPYGETTIPG